MRKKYIVFGGTKLILVPSMLKKNLKTKPKQRNKTKNSEIRKYKVNH